MITTQLLHLIHDHLNTFQLPEPWSVKVTGSPVCGRDPIAVQLGGGPLPTVASTLLAWADTLTDVRADAWRVPDGSSVHLAIRGRLVDGTTVHVYDSVGDDTRFGLEPDQERPVALACLREWAAFDQEVAA